MSIIAIIGLIVEVISAIPKVIDLVKEIIALIKQRKTSAERGMLFARLKDGIQKAKVHPVDFAPLYALRDELKKAP